MGRKIITDSTDQEVPQPTPDFLETHVALPEEVDVVIAPASGAGDSRRFNELKFNEDEMEVMVHESTDANAENPVFTACNGVSQYFFRGQVQKVKRKYVAILASAREHSLTTKECIMPDGSRGVKLERSASLKYPFSVISDPAGKRGADWLKSMLATPF